MRFGLLAMIWFIVAGVSVVDAYLSFKYCYSLHSTELNPIGRWLIRMDSGDVALFMTAKMVGTSFVLTIVPAICLYFEKHLSNAIIYGLGIFQISLLAFLLW